MTPLSELTPSIDVLPQTAAGKPRAVRWYSHLRDHGYTVDAAFIVQERGRGDDSYGLTEIPVEDETRRVFTVRKAGDPVPYCTTVSTEPGWSECTCAGSTYGRGRKCRHLEAVMTALDNGWIAPLPGERPAAWDELPTDAELDQMAAEYAEEERLARGDVLRVA
jgi:hypothetical protein